MQLVYMGEFTDSLAEWLVTDKKTSVVDNCCFERILLTTAEICYICLFYDLLSDFHFPDCCIFLQSQFSEKCYNCNRVGHLARNCRNSGRPFGESDRDSGQRFVIIISIIILSSFIITVTSVIN